MNRLSMAIAFALMTSINCALGAGALDFMDPCKEQEKKFATSSEAIEGQLASSRKSLEQWNADPTSIPDGVLNYYRAAVRTLAFRTWSTSPTGSGVIQSWKDSDPNLKDPTQKFLKYIYNKEISEEQEKKLARMIFKRDYQDHLKADFDAAEKEANQQLVDAKKKFDGACSSGVVDQVLRATIVRAVMLVNSNFDAAKDEHGELAKLVRAASGISLTDIMTHGIRGGPNSELNKLAETWKQGLNNVGIGPNSEIRKALAAIDPTNVSVPKPLQITVDGDSAKNFVRNLSGGLIK